MSDEEIAEFLGKVITARAGIRRKIIGIRNFIRAIEDKAKRDKIAFAKHCMIELMSKQESKDSIPEISWNDIARMNEILDKYK